MFFFLTLGSNRLQLQLVRMCIFLAYNSCRLSYHIVWQDESEGGNIQNLGSGMRVSKRFRGFPKV